jgi:hypothetical protein
MSGFEITGIRTEASATGYHKHISHVRIGTGDNILRRETVVEDIRSGGDSYFTEAAGVRADVVVVRCSDCTFNDYLRTDPDATSKNNLLSLPEI